ncbi:MAG TPA: EAL domain-containing protein [Gammaproteobacteria bacterium]|nr:EAL domain-containing protein [Gammaproteobacteria bacterium]
MTNTRLTSKACHSGTAEAAAHRGSDAGGPATLARDSATSVARGIAVRITLIYFVIAAGWILFSDPLFANVVPGSETLAILQGVKGWVFVLATSGLLYALVGGYTHQLAMFTERARHSEWRIRHMIESVPDILYTMDLPGFRVGFISTNVAANLGFDPDEFADNPHLWRNQLHEGDRERVVDEILDRLAHEGAFTVEYRMWHKDGTSVRWFRDNGRIENRDVSESARYFGVLTDITAHHEAEAKIRYLTNHDPLTGLLNQHGLGLVLDNLLRLEARQGGELSCLCLAVDRFGHINNAFGHKAGDEILSQVGRYLHDALRGSDVVSRSRDCLLARSSGGRFLIVLPATGLTGAGALAERLLGGIDELPIRYDGDVLRITGKIGIVGFPDHGTNSTDLLSRAENALHRARAAGPVHVYDVNEQLEDALSARWVERIHNALEKRQFLLHFQPILHIPSGTVHHYEVLVRMKEPDGTITLPSRFISVAERFGIIDRIDYQVLEMTIDYLEHLHPRYPDISLAVNLSGAHIGDTRLLGWLRDRLARSHVDGHKLIFELTETAAIDDLQQARALMDSLRELGCRFALDDFGIGFTSFVHLRSLPVDLVKIDGSFIRNLPSSREDQALVEAITRVAKAYRKEVVAEFVEDEPTLALLRRFHVDYAQGYHIGRPAAISPEDMATVG